MSYELPVTNQHQLTIIGPRPVASMMMFASGSWAMSRTTALLNVFLKETGMSHEFKMT